MRFLVALVVALAAAAPANAQVRLAAPPDCLTNPGCGPGLAEVYGLDVTSVFVPLDVADLGIPALDDGLAEVAVAFSSDPQVSRPDIVTLADDKAMIPRDRVVPIVRRPVARAHLRRTLNAVSRLITTRALRQLNQQVGDGRLPEAVGGEFIDVHGLGGRSPRRPGPRIVVGFQAFSENETLAWVYSHALRGAGYRTRVRPVGGLRTEALGRLRARRISMYPDYSASLSRHLEAPLRRALRRRNLIATRRAAGENRNVYVTTSATAAALGIDAISDLARFWPPAG